MESRRNPLDEAREKAPPETGVYLMKDGGDRVLYVGKAVNLRSRLRAYAGRTDGRAMIPFLVRQVDHVEFIVTETEKEALILENTLIKKHRPRYNVNLRDDKNYFSIRIDAGERFPRFQLVRKVKKDRARYFGPYASSAAVRETLRVLQPVFPLRTCGELELKTRTRPCIEYEMKRCLGPCRDFVEEEAYGEVVREAVSFLEGKGRRLLSSLRTRMGLLSREMRFEEAARVRDRIAALEETLEKQKVVSFVLKDRDVFGFFRSDERVQVSVLYVRQGHIQGQKPFPLLRTRADSGEVLSAVLKQYYDREIYLPGEILIPVRIEDQQAVEEWLTEKKGGPVRILRARRGEGGGLLTMAVRNAENLYQAGMKAGFAEEALLIRLQEKLRLKNRPRRIECYDISNVGGASAAGSRVTFLDGRRDPGGYRRYRIRDVEGADDCAMMAEVLRRRFEGPEEPPDLVVMDGGKGQLGVALAVMEDLGIGGVDAIGLAKKKQEEDGPGDGKETSGKVSRGEDRVYLPGRKNPLYLTRTPELLRLLQRIRDEAHRFALAGHRKIRDRAAFVSPLDSLPEIGPARKKKLLSRFGSLDGILTATAEELAATAGIGPKRALLVRELLDRAAAQGETED